MAETEEPRFTTLAERIAALNQQKNFQAPQPLPGKRAPPPPPPPAPPQPVDGSDAPRSPALPPRPGPGGPAKRLPPPLPRRTTEQESSTSLSVAPPLPHPTTDKESPPSLSAPPPLPARNSQQQLSPPQLPSRRPSNQTLAVRRNSNASDISQLSSVSTLSLNHTKSSASSGACETQTPRRLPPPLDQAKLPPLPPSRRELEAKAKEAAEKEAARSTPSLPPRRVAEPPKPSLPPRRPSKPANSPAIVVPEEPPRSLPPRRLPPPPSSFRPKSALECGFGSAPPPVPLSSRPTLAEIDAVASRLVPPPSLIRPASAPAPTHDCLTCRDFSGPDSVAARHPTSSLPRHDPVGHLARVLCDPFPSHTDKARAVFTWCHHNIVYDVHGFFNKCVPRGQTPADTIFSGKAVCEGYARVYEAVAARAGLACAVVTGHGKGFGFSPLKAGEPVPRPDPTGHAWNAVRVDGGRWKLVDACWGAGHLADGAYVQHFDPGWFTMSNDRFGLRHFPADGRQWYRADGRALSWDEYIVGPLGPVELAEWLGDATREGLDEHNFAPAQKRIAVHHGGGGGGVVVRFQFAKVCEHWTPERNGDGKQMLFALKIGGRDGRREDLALLEYDGFLYYVDVDARDLGAPGQTVALIGFTVIDGQSARGLTKEEWLRKKGRCGYSYAFLVRWELV